MLAYALGDAAVPTAADVAAGAAGGGAAAATSSGSSDSADDIAEMRQEIAAARASLEQQQRALDTERRRLESLEARFYARVGGAPAVANASQPGEVPLPVSPPPAAPSPAPAGTGVPSVGEAPTDQRQVEVAVLSEQGGIITKKGRLTIESDLEYARSDNNSVIFRGVEVPASVLIGVFDINQSRDDILTAAGVARFGVTNRLEINGRIPYVYRSTKSVLAPVADPSNPNAGQIDRPVNNGGLGDIDFGFRYQLTNGHNGSPYLIAGIQAVAPTGSNPFTVPRDSLGNALRAATGAGFWGIEPNLTAILPTDPAVLFGTIGYTYNLANSPNSVIANTLIERVWPGGEPSASVGIAISLNPRTSISLGYAHTWVMGTKSRLRSLDAQTGQYGLPYISRTRDLQLGRILFGISYRVNERTTINWNLEGGLTADATEVRSVLRIPLTLDLFH
jgi:hypothetical protein